MAAKIQFRRGTRSQWTTINPILSQGEPAYETDTGLMKIGDGVLNYNSLPYSSVPANYDPNTNTLTLDDDTIVNGNNF